MKKFVNLWRQLSNVGITPKMDLEIQSRVRVTNQMAGFFLGIGSFYIFLFWFLGFKALGALVIVPLCLYLATFYWNNIGKHITASIWLILVSNLAITIYAIAFGRASGIHLICLTSICLPWIFFQMKHIRYIIAGSILCVIPFIFVEAGFGGRFMVDVTPWGQRIIYLAIVFTVVYPVLAFYFYYFLSKNKHTRDTLNKLNASIETQNKMILEASESMEELMQEINSRNKEMEQMTYLASHDLRQPLNSINSAIQMIKKKYEDTFDELGKKCLQYAQISCTSMGDMISSLLEYSRLGKEDTFEQVDCNSLLGSVKVDLHDLITQKEAVVEVGGLPSITAYPTKLKLLFQNIINNAIKFQRPGNRPIVLVSAREYDSLTEFSIKDNGIGIAKKDFEKVFQIFQRLNTKDAYEGTGIGLAHCKKIVDLHRGKIWIESSPEEGTTFFFTIKNSLKNFAPIERT